MAVFQRSLAGASTHYFNDINVSPGFELDGPLVFYGILASQDCGYISLYDGASNAGIRYADTKKIKFDFTEIGAPGIMIPTGILFEDGLWAVISASDDDSFAAAANPCGVTLIYSR